MTFMVMPDLEAVVSKTLRDAGYSAYSSIPNDPTWPLLIVSRAGGIPPIRQYLDGARIQVDVWGGAKGDPPPAVTKSQIQDIAQTARTIIFALEGTTVISPVEAFISGVDDASGLLWLPDDATGRDRYLFAVMVYGRSLLPTE